MGGFERPFWERDLEANAPIVLSREMGQVEMGRWRFDGEIRVEMAFWPDPKVLVVMDLPVGSSIPGADGEVVFRLLSGTRRMAASLVENWCSTTERGRVVLRLQGEWVIGESALAVRCVGFGIPNFPSFRAGVIRQDKDGESHRYEEIRLQAGEWSITIVPAAGASDRCAQVKRRGGYGVTAIGRIWRGDGSQFGYAEVKPLLDELRFFLSFVLGQWTGPLRPTGLDERGAVVWERDGFPPFLDHGVKSVNWFSPDQADCLGSVFQGFHERWSDLDAREAVRFAIYWYVTAKSGANGIEGPLVMSVAGLETLAFWVLVKRKATCSKREYDDAKFVDRLRKMLEVVGLQMELPEMGEFTLRFPWPHGWIDGPQALKMMRNDLMHAEKKLKQVSYQSGWWLSQWYLELCLLWAFRYQGDYLDRRNLAASPGPVPWASGAGAGNAV